MPSRRGVGSLYQFDARAGAAGERFLGACRAEIRPRALDFAALLPVRAIDLLTHVAIERHPKTLEDGTLTEELTALALGYLGGEAHPRPARVD